MKLIKNLTVFTVGGFSYGLVEIAWRGATHISMFVVGGLCFLIIGSLDEHGMSMSLLTQSVLSAAIITSAELISGIIINIVMELNVWDYSALPLNLMGQICLPFTILWMIISVPAIYLEDAVRLFIFGEKMKRIPLIPYRRHMLSTQKPSTAE